MEPKKIICIVSGSSGIGLELVKLCIDKDYLIIASSRNATKTEALIQLKEKFPKNLKLLDIDVSMKNSINSPFLYTSKFPECGSAWKYPVINI